MFRSPSADLLIVLVIVLLFLGPKRLPGLGRSLGSGIREFKQGIGGHDEDGKAPAELPAEHADTETRAKVPAEHADTETRAR